MPQIGVNAPELVTYASAAEECFGSVGSTLGTLVNDCIAVDYSGENAAAFKRNVANAARDMGGQINTAMVKFTGDIAGATTAIAKSLGGLDVTVDFVPKPLPEVTVADATAGEQRADTDALSTLQETIQGHCKTILGHVSEHQSALGRTPSWVGAAKDTATSCCATLTTSVNDAVTAGLAKMTTFIAEQNTAVIGADNSAVA